MTSEERRRLGLLGDKLSPVESAINSTPNQIYTQLGLEQKKTRNKNIDLPAHLIPLNPFDPLPHSGAVANIITERIKVKATSIPTLTFLHYRQMQKIPNFVDVYLY